MPAPPPQHHGHRTLVVDDGKLCVELSLIQPSSIDAQLDLPQRLQPALNDVPQDCLRPPPGELSPAAA
jgi:hypothetical protein